MSTATRNADASARTGDRSSNAFCFIGLRGSLARQRWLGIVSFVLGLCACQNEADAWVTRFDGGGEIPGSTREDIVKDVAVYPNGDVVATGFLVPPAAENLAVVKLAGASGTEIWRYEESRGTGDSVVIADNGDVVVCGGTGIEFLVVRLSGATGQVVWRRALVGTQVGSRCRDAALNEYGDVLAVGSFNNTTTTNDFAIIKLSGVTGEVFWRTEIDGGASKFELAYEVALDGDGDAVAVGELEIPGVAGDRYSVVKVSGVDGAVVWQHLVEPSLPGNHLARGVAIMPDSDVVAAGHIADVFGDATFTVVRLASNDGGEVWRADLVGSDGVGRGYDVTIDSSGDVVVSGYLLEPDPVYSVFAVVKLSGTTGGEVWRHSIDGGTTFEKASALALDAADDVVAVGVLDNPVTRDDLVAVKLGGSSGASLWQTAIDVNANSCEGFTSVVIDAWGDILAAGGDDDSCAGSNATDFTVVKLHNGDGTDAPAPTCGNGIVEVGETCDDSGTTGGDGCSSDCQNEACMAATPGYPSVPLCDDGVACTFDSCDIATGVCLHSPSHALCNNGLFCDGVEMCDPISYCMPGSDPCSGQMCDEETNACVATTTSTTSTTTTTTTSTTTSATTTSTTTTVPGCFDTLMLDDCRVRPKFRKTPEGSDKLTIKCRLVDARNAVGDFDPVSEPVTLSVADAGGPCFAHELALGTCEQRSSGFKCSLPKDSTLLSRLTLKKDKAVAGTFRLKAKAKQTDVQCLSEAASPWVLGFQVGDDCGEVGCPATSTKPRCPDTCGDSVQDPGERCDTGDLGGETCVGLGFDGGVLSCAATCSFNVSGCVTTTTTTTTSTTTTTLGLFPEYDIVFQLDDPVTLGALGFTVDYTAAPGGFKGSGQIPAHGGTLECSGLIAGAQTQPNDDDAGSLNVPILHLAGFTGPVSLVSCVFERTGIPAPAAGDFVVTVTDAADTSAVPLPPPFPVVSVVSITPH